MTDSYRTNPSDGAPGRYPAWVVIRDVGPRDGLQPQRRLEVLRVRQAVGDDGGFECQCRDMGSAPNAKGEGLVRCIHGPAL